MRLKMERPSVLICFTGTPASARRLASLSVARSPARAAAAVPCSRSVRRVRCNNAVLPEPGLYTKLTARTPAAWSLLRRPRAISSFLLRMPLRIYKTRVFMVSPSSVVRRSRSIRSPTRGPGGCLRWECRTGGIGSAGRSLARLLPGISHNRHSREVLS